MFKKATILTAMLAVFSIQAHLGRRLVPSDLQQRQVVHNDAERLRVALAEQREMNYCDLIMMSAKLIAHYTMKLIRC